MSPDSRRIADEVMRLVMGIEATTRDVAKTEQLILTPGSFLGDERVKAEAYVAGMKKGLAQMRRAIRILVEGLQ